MLNLKEHIKLTSVYTFFAAFPAFLQLIVYPIIEGTDRLGAEDFGYLAITEAIISFAVIFCLFGMAIAITRFYYDYIGNKDGYKKLISTIFTGILGRAILLLGIVIIVSPFVGQFFSQIPLQRFVSYGPFLIIIAFNRAVIAVALSLYRNEKNIKLFIIVSFFSGFLRTAFQLIGVFFFNMSFLGYIYGTAIGGVIVSLSLVLFIWIKLGFHFNLDIHKPLAKFSRSLVFNDLIFWGVFFFDRFFLLKNPTDLGIYDNAMKFAIGIQFINQGLAGAIQPELFQYFKKGFSSSEKEIKMLSNLFILETIVIIAISILPVMIFINNFYETELIISSGLIALVFMRYILNAVYQVFAWPIIYMKNTRVFYTNNSIVLIIVLLMNIILVPYIGYYGAIIAFLTASIVQVLLFFNTQKKIIAINWNIYKVLYFPILLVIITGILESLKHYFNISSYITSSVFVVFVFSLIFLIYKNEIKDLIQKLKITYLRTNNTNAGLN